MVNSAQKNIKPKKFNFQKYAAKNKSFKAWVDSTTNPPIDNVALWNSIKYFSSLYDAYSGVMPISEIFNKIAEDAKFERFYPFFYAIGTSPSAYDFLGEIKEVTLGAKSFQLEGEDFATIKSDLDKLKQAYSGKEDIAEELGVNPKKKMGTDEFLVRMEDLFKEEIKRAAQSSGKQNIASANSLSLEGDLWQLLEEKVIDYQGKQYKFEDFFRGYFGIDKVSYLGAKIKTLNDRYGKKTLMRGNLNDLKNMFHKIRAEILVHALNLRDDDRTNEYLIRRKRSFEGVPAFEANEEELSSYAYIYLVAMFWKYFKLTYKLRV